MNTRRTPARRVDQEVIVGIPPGDEQVPQGVLVPQGVQVPIVVLWEEVSVVPPYMTNVEIREFLLTLARAMMAQTN